MKNIELAETMDRLIKIFRRRDTKGNIKRLQDELDALAAQTNPLKKCLSMYKIKEKMDQIENVTLAEEKKLKIQQEQALATASSQTDGKGKKFGAGKGGAGKETQIASPIAVDGVREMN